MENSPKQKACEIRKSKDAEEAFLIASKLPDFFNEDGLRKIKEDTKNHILYGAYLEGNMVGFVTYVEINSDAVEMSWLGVLPEKQKNGIGKKLVTQSLREMSSTYKVCEVKTLSETDPYEPYKNTRAFYKCLGFIPIETIHPYPGWGDNPCQIFIKCIGN